MIYLDNAATTAVFPEVMEAMWPWYCPDHVGNASSIHTLGVNAHKAIEEARAQVAALINAEPSEIFFTSGGTESNNTWLSCIPFGDEPCCRVLLTRMEHHSILDAVKHRYSISYLNVDRTGAFDLKDLERMLSFRTYATVVSAMWVNNELGTVNPIKQIGEICKKHGIPFHTDAVQAVGHVPIDVKECNVDFLSMSGHKFGAPPGVGALYIRSGIQKKPLIRGGGQENGMRGGTYNVPGIVGIGKAAEIVTTCLNDWRVRWGVCRSAFLTELGSRMFGEFYVNGDSENYCSNIISLTIPGVNSEALLLLLDQQEIYLSAGSACSAADAAPSHVLKGIGMSDEDAASTVRISMGFNTREKDMKRTARAIAEAVKKLKSMYS